MRRSSYYRTKGRFPNLKLVSEELLDPMEDEVQVAVRAIGLNFADVFCLLGLYNAAPKKDFIPGLEFAGEVLKVGRGVRGLSVGQRVIGVTLFGAYTSHINVTAAYCMPIPEAWSYPEGSAYLVQTLTAYYALVTLGRLREGETVLIQSVAGGVGLAALAIAKKYACHVIGVVGKDSKITFAKEQGCDEVLMRGAALPEKELDIVLECSGGSAFMSYLERLAPGGRIISYGLSRYMPEGPLTYLRMVLQYLTRPRLDIERTVNRTVSTFNLIYLFDKAEEMRRLLAEAQGLGLPAPRVSKIYGFHELPQALVDFKSGGTIGKLVVHGVDPGVA